MAILAEDIIWIKGCSLETGLNNLMGKKEAYLAFISGELLLPLFAVWENSILKSQLQSVSSLEMYVSVFCMCFEIHFYCLGISRIGPEERQKSKELAVVELYSWGLFKSSGRLFDGDYPGALGRAFWTFWVLLLQHYKTPYQKRMRKV